MFFLYLGANILKNFFHIFITLSCVCQLHTARNWEIVPIPSLSYPLSSFSWVTAPVFRPSGLRVWFFFSRYRLDPRPFRYANAQ